MRISEGVNDPLTATACVLESADGEHVVMISQDSVYLDESILLGLRENLESTCPGLDPMKVYGSATHTHSGPSPAEDKYPICGPNVISPEAYGSFVVKRMAQAVKEAWESREEGGVGFGSDYAYVGCNRRMTKYSGESVMYGNTNDEQFSHIEGDEDHTVNILTTYDADNKLTGMIVNIACPSQVTEGDLFVSADYWHDARCEIRSRFGDNLFILPQCSAAGDQSPHMMIGRKAQARMLHLQAGVEMADNERDTLEMRMAHRKELARRIADAAEKVLPIAAKDIRAAPVLKHVVETVDLPKRMATAEERDMALEKVKQAEKGLAECDQDPTSFAYSRNYIFVRYFGQVVERFETQDDDPVLPMEMHVVRLADVVFATNRFELFLDYGQRIKAGSKATQTFLIQLAGGGTYLPSQRAVDARSYGAGIESNLVGPAGGKVLVDRTIELINSMFE